MPVKRVYWDTSCFISFLSGSHPRETARSIVCEDVLQDARNNDIEIWTSVWTIAETVRPRKAVSLTPQPSWAAVLAPEDSKQFTEMWEYYKRNTAPTRVLSDVEAQKIRGMFDWPWIHKIQVIPAIAHHAAEIARKHNLKPGDSLHVASALSRRCSVIHRWDKDYSKTDALIPSSDPMAIPRQSTLLPPYP